MFEIKGKINTAICYAKVVEDDAIEQIRRMCDYEFTKDSKIRIMPDVHAGKGCTIGTTMTVTDKVVPNIVGVKEATGDILDLERKIARYGERFLFYSGSDELVLPSYSVGAVGVISAVANVIPCEMVTLCQLIEQNEWQRARELTHKISPLIKELYREVNPVAVKCALSLLGLCQNELRLPLAPSSRENQIAGELIKLKQE